MNMNRNHLRTNNRETGCTLTGHGIAIILTLALCLIFASFAVAETFETMDATVTGLGQLPTTTGLERRGSAVCLSGNRQA
ncbi:MAG: hypothetical protein IJ088_07760 [Clostridia bacterium]|nr:hypothetical protein [Clostridia bacterium]